MGLPQNQYDEQQHSVVKEVANQQIKKQGKKVAKKIGKAVARQALGAVRVLGAALLKAFLALLSAIGLPTLFIVIGIIFVVILFSLVSSYMFGTGEGLKGEERKIHEYIMEQANKTVNMSSSIEREYRVPHELIAAVIQMDVMKGKNHKEVAKNMATALKPVFEYEKFNEWTETQTKVCRDGSCGSWGKSIKTDNWVSKLINVDHWRGHTNYEFTPYVTKWETTSSTRYETVEYQEEVDGEVVTKTRQIEIVTYTRTRHQKFNINKHQVEDYSNFDTILSSYGFGINDKKLIEANFLLAGGTSNYLRWLETNYSGAFFGGSAGIGFNGTIIPGDNVPAQFMPYYLKGEQLFGVPWYILASIHFVETGFSTHPTMISPVGAIGPMQFMPATWAGWTYNIGGGRVGSNIDITSVAVISRGNGYGTDGDGDGKADPWNEADAIVTAAKYLASNGFAEDPKKAIFAYNRADWYVEKVLRYAESFKASAIYKPSDENMPPITDGDFMRPTTGSVTSPYGPRWGRMHHGIDIGKNGRTGSVPIVSVADGIVVKSYYSSSYGNCVIIRHTIRDQQFESLYAHLESRAVRTGQMVQKGQFLGNMGNTGRSTGPHLHFELHVGSWNSSKSNSVNPLLYIPQ